MDFGQGFQRALGILKLDAKAVKDASKDSGDLTNEEKSTGLYYDNPAELITATQGTKDNPALGTRILELMKNLGGNKGTPVPLIEPVQTRKLKDGSTIKVRKGLDGQYHEVK